MSGKSTKSLKERFEEKIYYSPDGCWYWTGCAHRYGKILIKGVSQLAHRVSYELYKGNIPNGMHVLHGCDNTLCVNPSHLRVGTHLENMIDASIRSKMLTTTEQVMEIREDLKKGIPIFEIAKKNRLSQSYISGIKKGWLRKNI